MLDKLFDFFPKIAARLAKIKGLKYYYLHFLEFFSNKNQIYKVQV